MILFVAICPWGRVAPSGAYAGVRRRSAPSEFADGAYRRNVPTDLAVGVRRRSLPSECADGASRRTAPTELAVGVRRRSSVLAKTGPSRLDARPCRPTSPPRAKRKFGVSALLYCSISGTLHAPKNRLSFSLRHYVIMSISVKKMIYFG